MIVSAAVFACHSKACAPPPAGTGGSDSGGAKYHPSSVTVEQTGTGKWQVVDRSVDPKGLTYGAWANTWDEANSRANIRRGVIRAALTRRSNKAKAATADPLLALARSPKNAQAIKDHGSPEALVKWLRQELTDPEAAAWLES